MWSRGGYLSLRLFFLRLVVEHASHALHALHIIGELLAEPFDFILARLEDDVRLRVVVTRHQLDANRLNALRVLPVVLTCERAEEAHQVPRVPESGKLNGQHERRRREAECRTRSHVRRLSDRRRERTLERDDVARVLYFEVQIFVVKRDVACDGARGLRVRHRRSWCDERLSDGFWRRRTFDERPQARHADDKQAENGVVALDGVS
mmetsp:Transcript_12020/g.30242  ORF Transcript_12020/g.30242 Transcript_12020/m.30242 type:complete len:207 (-) Transcript_12020:479-1099(-)